jgi:endonuclease G
MWRKDAYSRGEVRELAGTELRITSVLGSRKMRDAIAEAAAKRTLPQQRTFGSNSPLIFDQLSASKPSASDVEFFDSQQTSEAIILATGRPVLLVKDGVFEKAPLPLLEQQLGPHRAKLVAPINSVGRVELYDHDTYEWCGTGWRVDEDLIVTNRHVALLFAQRQGRFFKYRVNQVGKQVRARIDFREEYKGLESEEINIGEILWIAEDTSEAPDMAILRTEKDSRLPAPLKLFEGKLQPEQQIAVVGYPARDSRNDATVMRDIFGDIFDVKRFAPGQVVSVPTGEWHFTHDSSTLGGNSGSAVLDIDSKSVAGLHFGGQFRKTNYAVKASVIKSLLARRSWVPVSRQEFDVAEESFSEKKRTVAYMKNRKGFDTKFLSHAVALPKPGKSHEVVETPLLYTHFTVIQSESRHLPVFTAVNIDGALKKNLKRKDAWGFDPRLPKDLQTGHADFYGPAAFDKGHMVRREDPGWGKTIEEAQLGEEDTFVYPNAVPQVPQLNQRTWLSLEDYVLQNAKTRGFKVSVFTGPVFRDDDPVYEAIQVPLDFWKVVAMIDEDTGALSVSAYMLSQEGMMPTEGFRYGPFKTYQVPLTKVATDADLKFSSTMLDADVFGADGLEEAMSGGRYVEITTAEDVVLERAGKRRRKALRKS